MLSRRLLRHYHYGFLSKKWFEDVESNALGFSLNAHWPLLIAVYSSLIEASRYICHPYWLRSNHLWYMTPEHPCCFELPSIFHKVFSFSLFCGHHCFQSIYYYRHLIFSFMIVHGMFSNCLQQFHWIDVYFCYIIDYCTYLVLHYFYTALPQ